MSKKTIKFKNEELHLQFGRYQDTNMVALQLYDSNGFPYMTASFNPVEVPDISESVISYKDTNRMIAIKDWSENEGIEKALLDNNVLEEYISRVPTGYVIGNAYTVNKEFLGDK